MRYCVREIVDNKVLADENGIAHFDTVELAKMGGIGYGASFAVVEDVPPFVVRLCCLNTGMGFFFLDGTLKNKNAYKEPEMFNIVQDMPDQAHILPLV